MLSISQECSHCGKTLTIIRDGTALTPWHIVYTRAREQGWLISLKRKLCPTCHVTQKRKHVA